MTIFLTRILKLKRCPHCSIATPNLYKEWETTTSNCDGYNQRVWKVYKCQSCGGLVTATSSRNNQEVKEFYPYFKEIDVSLPNKPKSFLEQALNSLNAPSGAIMLAASAVDAMLKEKGYIEGDLFPRIEKAANEHLITQEMKEWAHQVRLDANIQRHADKDSPLPDHDDARRTVDFAIALAEFLYVLPSKVNKGIKDSKPKEEKPKEEKPEEEKPEETFRI